MQEYFIRQATSDDISFLAESIIAAEKSNSGKLSFSTLFNIPEYKVKDLIIIMFKEEINGCEFSVSSYLITEYKGEPIAVLGAWIEAFNGDLSSKFLKSNLISSTFGRQVVNSIKDKVEIISDILIEREPMTLQFEYMFADRHHQKKGVAEGMINKHISDALAVSSALKKAQAQIFKNNLASLKLVEKLGFRVVKIFRSDHRDVLDYLSCNEKLLMEKPLK